MSGPADILIKSNPNSNQIAWVFKNKTIAESDPKLNIKANSKIYLNPIIKRTLNHIHVQYNFDYLW